MARACCLGMPPACLLARKVHPITSGFEALGVPAFTLTFDVRIADQIRHASRQIGEKRQGTMTSTLWPFRY